MLLFKLISVGLRVADCILLTSLEKVKMNALRTTGIIPVDMRVREIEMKHFRFCGDWNQAGDVSQVSLQFHGVRYHSQCNDSKSGLSR